MPLLTVRLASSIAVAAVVVTSCSSSNELTAPPSVDDGRAADATDTSAIDQEPAAFDTDDDPAADPDDRAPSTTEFDLAAQPSTPLIEPVPETGVPGIDSADAFCRAWSQYGGSFQALALVSAERDLDAALGLELLGSTSVIDAHTAMAAELPPELEVERTLFIDQLLGPFATRARLAQTALVEAGIETDGLSEYWLAALSEQGVDSPNLSLEPPPNVDPDAFAAAISGFSASFEPDDQRIVDDDSLVTNAVAPLSTDYLASNCPDRGILAGNDEVGG